MNWTSETTPANCFRWKLRKWSYSIRLAIGLTKPDTNMIHFTSFDKGVWIVSSNVHTQCNMFFLSLGPSSFHTQRKHIFVCMCMYIKWKIDWISRHFCYWRYKWIVKYIDIHTHMTKSEERKRERRNNKAQCKKTVFYGLFWFSSGGIRSGQYGRLPLKY